MEDTHPFKHADDLFKTLCKEHSEYKHEKTAKQ